MEYLLRTERSDLVRETLEAPDADLHVPALCDVELTSALRHGLLSGAITAARARHALEDHLALPITRHGHQYLLERILALRENFSAYDATYVALAERLGAQLLTADAALGRAVRAHSDIPTLPG